MGLTNVCPRPDPPLCHHLRGIMHERLGHLHAAMHDYDAAARADPENHMVLYCYGVKCRQLGLLSQAVGAFKGCLSLQPDSEKYNRALLEASDLQRNWKEGRVGCVKPCAYKAAHHWS